MNRLATVGLIVVISIIGLLLISNTSTAHPSADSAWATPLNLSDNDGGSQQPTVLTNDLGYVHVLWEDNAFEPYDERIYHRVRDPQGNWSSIETIPNSQTGSYVGYAAALDSQGIVHAIWRRSGSYSNNNVAYYSQRTTAGAWTEPQELQGLELRNYISKIQIDASDKAHIMSAAIYLKRSAEGVWSAPSYPFGLTPLGADMAVDSAGDVHAVAGDSGEIYYTKLMSDATWAAPINVSNNATLSYAPHIYVDYQGRTHFWWINVTGPNRNGFFYRSLLNGVLTEIIPLTDVPDNSDLGFVAVGADGVVHLVSGGDYTNRSLDGVWSTPVHQNAGQSTLALAPGGEVHWFWNCGDTSCQWSDLLHASLQTNGIWSPTTNLGRRNSLPSVSFGINGEVAAAWPRWIEQEDDVDIFFSDYTPKNVPTSTPTPTVTATPMQTATPTPTATPIPGMFLPVIQN